MSPRRVAIVFDLTPDMTFRLTDGTTVTLAELERMVRLAPATGYTGYAPEADSQTGTGQHVEPRVGAVRRENPRVAQMGAQGAARPQRVSRGVRGAGPVEAPCMSPYPTAARPRPASRVRCIATTRPGATPTCPRSAWTSTRPSARVMTAPRRSPP